jgi:hypothetical protein
MTELRAVGKRLANKLMDLAIVLYAKGKFWLVIMYYYCISLFRVNHRIIYASMKTETGKRNVLNELITFYDYDSILSCASLQRWFREKFKLRIIKIKFIYLCEGKPVLRKYDLDEDEGLSRQISFKGDLEYSDYGSVALE